MKNIILLIVLLLPFHLKSQNNDQRQDDINSNLFHVEYRNQLSFRFKKVCKPGVYSRLEKYFLNDDHLKYVIDGYDIFKYKNKLMVGRYHSLKLKEPFYAQNFDITMRCVI